MIEVVDLVKVFGGVRALDGLSLHVGKGAVYGLVGPNGAGKTTALQHIAGVYRATGGEVRVGGQPVFERPDVKEAIAFIPSDFYFFRQARVADMRDLHAAVYPRFDRGRFDELGWLFGFDLARPVRSLSKGMVKQLAFWLALSQRPDVLLLDEPLDGLDPAARRAVLGVVMEEVAEREMTVLVSSHNLRELSDICDYVGIMEAGAMRLERSLADLQDNVVKVQVAFGDGSGPGTAGDSGGMRGPGEGGPAEPYAPNASAVPADPRIPAGLDIVSAERQGKLHTLVVRASAAEATRALEDAGATFINVLPLSLEEIFVYEIGGAAHERENLD